MKADPYYFEIKDVIAQFLAAFDDIVIKRFNKDRAIQDKVHVRYVYAPKQRVMHDIINENKTIDLPVVAFNITSITRDVDRVFNKLDGFYYASPRGTTSTTTHIKSPVPVNITLDCSILARYQTDIDQIISNFVPFCNPYVVISWYMPKAFDLAADQEIRSEVLWSGNLAMNYPVELNASQKARVTADTTFTIKGWLFKDIADPAGNIFFIDQNFTASDYITEYEAMTGLNTLSAVEGSYNPALSSLTVTESFELSGSPYITDILYNGVLLQNDLVVDTTEQYATITLRGTSLGFTENVLLSTTCTSTLSTLTANGGLTAVGPFQRQGGPLSGQIIKDVNIVNDNTLTFQIDNRYLDMKGNITFVPYNTAGYYSSWQSYLSADAPAGVDAKGNPTTFLRYPQGFFIQVEPLPIDINKTILSVAGTPNNAALFIPEDCD